MEHRNQLMCKQIEYSVVPQYRMFGHDFDRENVKILDKEKFYTKRIVSEVFFILGQRNNLNLREDTKSLSINYLPIIERFQLT